MFAYKAIDKIKKGGNIHKSTETQNQNNHKYRKSFLANPIDINQTDIKPEMHHCSLLT